MHTEYKACGTPLPLSRIPKAGDSAALRIGDAFFASSASLGIGVLNSRRRIQWYNDDFAIKDLLDIHLPAYMFNSRYAKMLPQNRPSDASARMIFSFILA